MSFRPPAKRHRDGLGIGVPADAAQQPCDTSLVDFRAFGEHGCMGDHRGELQDIARPVVSQQGLARFLGKTPGKRAAGGKNMHMASARKCSASATMSSWRRRSGGMSMRTAVQIVVQPRVEAVLGYRRLQIARVGGDHSDPRLATVAPLFGLRSPRRCKASSNFTWAQSGSCATPSRNNVPH